MKRIIIATLLGLARQSAKHEETLAALERFAFLLFEHSPAGSVAEEFGDDLMVACQCGEVEHVA